MHSYSSLHCTTVLATPYYALASSFRKPSVCSPQMHRLCPVTMGEAKMEHTVGCRKPYVSFSKALVGPGLVGPVVLLPLPP